MTRALQCKKDRGKGEGHTQQQDRMQSLRVQVNRTQTRIPSSGEG
jgi:hypothetical protein